MARKARSRVALLAGLRGVFGTLLGTTATHFLELRQDQHNAFEGAQRESWVAFLTAVQKVEQRKQRERLETWRPPRH